MIFVVLSGLTLLAVPSYGAGQCPPEKGVALQVLGSGGPIADDARASSSYLVWVDGAARVMIDAGGGAFLRFGEAGANFADLDFIGLSHFHTDHSADFPALLKSGYFSERNRELTIAGPDGGGAFPGLVAFVDRMLDPDDGAYAYLSGYLDGSAGLAEIKLRQVSHEEKRPLNVYHDEQRGLSIDAMHVPHGIVPAIAFRVTVEKVILVFAGDQNGSDARFVDFAKNADVLVMHLAIPETADGTATRLHAVPSIIGRIAADANVSTLMLSHLMARSIRSLDESLKYIRSAYSGTVLVADDLDCRIISPAR